MMKVVNSLLKHFLTAILIFIVGSLVAEPMFTVDVSKKISKISPTMFGVFIEDINFAADGGLYAELVKNRSFEFDRPLRGWQRLQEINLDNRVLFPRDMDNPRNPRFAEIMITDSDKPFGLQNEGFRGMGIREGDGYRFAIMVQQVDGNISAIRAELVDSQDRFLGSCQVEGFTSDWELYETEFIATGTDPKSKLNLYFEGEGRINIDMVSLFPKNTWRARKNGLRKDIVQLLADMKPGFLRFPGGCIVEGFDLSQRYQWKHTVGAISDRVCTINRWNFEFSHRPTPDYYQSFGLGFYEYFLLADDLDAEPIPIINCGMACQFNSAELVPVDGLDPYVQDALDLIEFANGAADSKWGELRAEMGHPEPFNMKMIGIGNEQWGPQYIDRYRVFAKAIKDKYPDMQLIATTGSDGNFFPNGINEIQYLWEQWRELKPEIVDEHYYRSPEWFLENVGWYDDYERDSPKLFVGEYAAHDRPNNRNNWKSALYEAAFMTGMERNADLVTMSCYAPLLAHEEAWQWRPDLIWFDNFNAYGSANYYVQKLFSLNKGTHLLKTKSENVPALREKVDALNISSVLDEKEDEVVIKVVNVADEPIEVTISLDGVEKGMAHASIILLTSASLEDENSIDNPKKIYPAEAKQTINRTQFAQIFQPNSLTIIRIPLK